MSLLQAETRAQSGAAGTGEAEQMETLDALAGIDEAEQIETFRAFIGQADVQSAMARAAAITPVQGGVERLTRLMENGSVDAALAGAVNSAIPDDFVKSPLPPELERIRDEMRVALRKLAPNPSHAAAILQQFKAKNGNVSLPAETAERVREGLASAGEAWRRNHAARDGILDYLPQLSGLLSNPDLFEPLKSTSNSLRDQIGTP